MGPHARSSVSSPHGVFVAATVRSALMKCQISSWDFFVFAHFSAQAAFVYPSESVITRSKSWKVHLLRKKYIPRSHLEVFCGNLADSYHFSLFRVCDNMVILASISWKYWIIMCKLVKHWHSLQNLLHLVKFDEIVWNCASCGSDCEGVAAVLRVHNTILVRLFTKSKSKG